MSVYNPHIDKVVNTYKQICDRHAAELAYFDLTWREYKDPEDPDGRVIQLVPVYEATFKGLV